jgi:hypothetical protein
VTETAAFLRWLVETLEQAGIAYMVTGSLASTFHGEHRATADVDVVVDPTEQQLERFLRSVGEEFYVSADAAREALRRRWMFNVIHPAGGWKADLILRKDRPFSREEFSRRVQAVLEGVPLLVASPEDVILSKLEWSRQAESERQFRDALGVALVQHDRLDWKYLDRWGRAIGVEGLVQRLRSEVGKKDPNP